MSAHETQVSIFDAVERYQAARIKLESLGDVLEQFRERELPGIEDLLTQYSVLRTTMNEASRKFDLKPGQISAEQHLRSRDLKIIRNLEILIAEFSGIVEQAQEELDAEPLSSA